MSKLLIISLTILFLAGVIFHMKGHYKVLLVLSDSMYPKIKKYALVVAVKKKDLEVGDTVSYKFIDMPIVTHRIVSKNNTSVLNNFLFVTKGDNNKFEDARKPTSNDIIGKVVLVVPYVGWLFTPSLFGLVFYAPFGVFVGALLKKIMLSSNYGKISAR